MSERSERASEHGWVSGGEAVGAISAPATRLGADSGTAH